MISYAAKLGSNLGAVPFMTTPKWENEASWCLIPAFGWSQIPKPLLKQSKVIPVCTILDGPDFNTTNHADSKTFFATFQTVLLAADNEDDSLTYLRRLITAIQKLGAQDILIQSVSPVLIRYWQGQYSDAKKMSGISPKALHLPQLLGQESVITDVKSTYSAQTTSGNQYEFDSTDLGPTEISLTPSVPKSAVEASIQELIRHALGSEATDIHIENRKTAQSQRLTVRMRVHGEMHVVSHGLASVEGEAIANYLFSKGRKGNSHWQPDTVQDGAVDVPMGGTKSVELRLAVIPEARGWDLILRLIDHQQELPRLEDLGYFQDQLTLLKKAFNNPSGLIIFAGPSGSGKSTSLQSVLVTLPAYLKIASIEQPAERLLESVSQVTSANAQDLAEIVPALNRWDCDLLVLGEIRDKYTGAAVSSLVTSGHLTCATVHAAKAQTVTTRLLDLGVRKGLLKEEGFIQLIIYQRLVPILCASCSLDLSQYQQQTLKQTNTKTSVTKTAMSHLNALVEDQPILRDLLRFRGDGCNKCYRGHIGRRVCAELWVPKLANNSALKDSDNAQNGNKSQTVSGCLAIGEVAKRLVTSGQLDLFEAERLIGKVELNRAGENVL